MSGGGGELSARADPSPPPLLDAAANVYDLVRYGGVADLRPMPSRIVHEAPQCTLFRYLDDERAPRRADPVLLVPPLAGSTRCFDLRRGQSFAEHLLRRGHPTFLLDYGTIAFGHRGLGLEHWVGTVVPDAERVVAAIDGPPHLVSWSLGGIFCLLAAAVFPDLPARSITAVASPVDATKVAPFPIPGPLRLALGVVGTAASRALGVTPEAVVRQAFRLAALDKELTKPVARLANLHDREALASMEAVDRFIDDLNAYPGRAVGQLLHTFFRFNDLADGRLRLAGQAIDLADVRLPVLAVAGRSDVLAPVPSVTHVAQLLPGSPDVRTVAAPGGHLGVLTGRSARDTTWVAIDAFTDAHRGG